MRTAYSFLFLLLATHFGPVMHWAMAADQPQWGRSGSRNLVSEEVGLPTSFEPGSRPSKSGEVDLAGTKNVRWVARLGSRTYSSPVVADGRVLIGTNNDEPRDETITDDRGVLLCLDEQTGRFQWQLIVPKIDDIKFFDSPRTGITSTPTVVDGRVYVMSNRCEVMCLDLDGMADGNDGPYRDEGRHMTDEDEPLRTVGPQDADIIWCYDIVKELAVRSHDSSNCSILVHDGLLYITTANGLGVAHAQVYQPDAPAMIVLDQETGALVARDDFGVDGQVVHGQWSSPALGQVGGRTLVFFGAGNGVVYAFEALRRSEIGSEVLRIRSVWSFNGQPEAQHGEPLPFQPGRGSDSYTVVATPVFHEGRVYVAFSHDPWLGNDRGWLAAIDAAGSGDITRSGLVWSRTDINDCLSSVAIDQGLLYLADNGGMVYCMDAASGEPLWTHDATGNIWGSTLVADSKIYFGTNRQAFWTLATGRKLNVLSETKVHDQIFSTPTAAGGRLYLATGRYLYAISVNGQ